MTAPTRHTYTFSVIPNTRSSSNAFTPGKPTKPFTARVKAENADKARSQITDYYRGRYRAITLVKVED